MLTDKQIDIPILRITYDNSIAPGCEKVTVEQKSKFLKASFSQVKDWFERIMTEEMSKVEQNVKLYFMEWEIATSSRNLFVVNDLKYDEIYIIFGSDKMHWCYYTIDNPQMHLAGAEDMSLRLCVCCLAKQQYVKTMRTIQEMAMQPW